MFEKITTIVKGGMAWGREFATGNDGIGSASRVVALIVTTTVSGTLIAHICLNHGLPDAGQLYGLAAMITAGCGAFAVGKFRQGDKDDDQGHGVQADPPQGGQ